jgi:general nucleoside transport system ATP-binding protein
MSESLVGERSGAGGAVVSDDRPPALELRGITKVFGGRAALDDVGLRVEPGSVHCLLGENGAGKSTLCNVVFGVHQPDAGEISVEGAPFRPRSPADALGRGVAMVHQHFSLVPTLSAADNLMLGPLRWQRPRQTARARILELSERYGMAFDPDVPVEQLSIGERQRAEIVKCLARDPHLLVLDEPTAVLPPAEVNELLDLCRRVAREGHAVLLVTHKLAEVAYVGDRATVLRGGRLAGTVPLPETPSSKLVELMVGDRIEEIDSAVAAAIGLAGDAAADAGQTPTPTPRRAPVPVDAPSALRLGGIGFKEGERDRLLDVEIDVRAGEVVGVAGVEGNGQSELARVAAGFLSPDAGAVQVAGDDVTRLSPGARAARGLAVVPEDRHAEAVVDGMSVADNLALGNLGAFKRFGLVRRRALMAHAGDLMQRFDVRAAGPSAEVATLSGGNQQRVVLARELTRDPLVAIVAAQPTRGLDVGAVSAVLHRLREAAEGGAGVLVISSELPELFTLCDRVVVLYRGQVVGEVDPTAPDALERVGTLMTGAKA